MDSHTHMIDSIIPSAYQPQQPTTSGGIERPQQQDEEDLARFLQEWQHQDEESRPTKQTRMVADIHPSMMSNNNPPRILPEEGPNWIDPSSSSADEDEEEDALFSSSHDEDLDDEDDPINPEDNIPTEEEMATQLAQAMNSLSLEEREKVLEDIHGVAQPVRETPALLQSKREAYCSLVLQIVSSKKQAKKLSIPTAHWQALQLAMEQDATYFQQPQRVDMFLRSRALDVSAAVGRLAAFCKAKLDLFGLDLLTTDITLDILERHHPGNGPALACGFLQLLPARDRAGRAVVLGLPVLLQSYESLLNPVRAFYYILMTALQDEATQKHGIVIVGWNVAKAAAKKDPRMVTKIQKLRQVLPVQIAAFHYCYDQFLMRPILTVAQLASNVYGKVRIRPHYATQVQDLLLELLSVGLPTDLLPVTASDGTPKVKAFKTWLKQRRDLERSFVEKNGMLLVVIPQNTDVLFGRGKPIQDSMGNLRYRMVVDRFLADYEAAAKFQKQALVNQVVALVQGYGGRFLKPHCGGWMVVSDEMAQEKVAHAFRMRKGSSASIPEAVALSSSSNTDRLAYKRPRDDQ